MQLNLTTDYAIRMVIYLADRNCTVSSKEISDCMKIPYTTTTKLVIKLKKAGYVSTQSGVIGGVSLIKKPESITLYDLVLLMENNTKINRCLEKERFCSRNASAYCSVHAFFASLQDDMEWRLKSMTIKDLLQNAT